MHFEAILDQALAMLQRRGRVTYRTLKLQFSLDDEQLAALKDELLYSQPHVVDDEGRGLVWTGDAGTAPAISPSAQPPPQAAIHQDQTAPDARLAAERGTAEAERRQLTVLFCDLVDSTALASRLDPEDLREIVRAYQATCAEVIQRFEGHIAQYLGDGLLVYFGYPQAHEDDAQRAVRTGLGIVEALRGVNAHLESRQGVRLAVRIGIHTGLVVVGEVGGGSRQEQLALGDTPNIAARLQGLAAPDMVVLSHATFRLVQGFFTYQDLGLHTLKGVTAPVQVYGILGESGVQSRLDVAAPSGLSPLVGREEEVALLRRRWEQAAAGLGQVVLLSGEAGIGKSRLVQVLKEHVAHEPHTRIEWRGSPYHQQSALYPVIDHLHRLLRWHPDDPPAERLHTLEETLAASGLAPQRQRQKTLDTLLTWLYTEARRQPVLLIVEDLHWIDPSTLELLSLLIDQGSKKRLCLVLTAHPEFHPPWAMVAHLTPLTLRRFAPAQVERLAAHVAGDKGLPPALLQEVVRKTDGVPLFVEELTKTVLESGLLREQVDHYELPGPLPPLAIPATLHDALMARLDRLATVKAVAQLGATIERSFSYGLLQAVAPLDAATLQGALAQLVEAELIAQRGIPPQATYTFKHALIQDAAYQSLLRSTPQQYHQRIAQVLETRFPETIDLQPELLAYHLTEAGSIEQAIEYWYKAGERAREHSAYMETIAHLTTGLALLKTLPETHERSRQELSFQTALGPALMAANGQGAPEVEQTYVRARELCEQVGETTQFSSVLYRLWLHYTVRAEHQTAHALAEQFFSVAQRLHDSSLLLEAHRMLGSTLFWLGELTPARRFSEQGSVLYEPHQHRVHAIRYGFDPGVACLFYTAHTLWFQGYADQALAKRTDALTLAHELSHPLSLAWTLCHTALFHQFRQEAQAACEAAEAAMALSIEQGFPVWRAIGAIVHGWVLCVKEQAADGVAQLRENLTAYRATGAELLCPAFLAMLAEVCGALGQTDAGLIALTEALALAKKNGECFWEAECHRLQGQLVLTQEGTRKQRLVFIKLWGLVVASKRNF